MSSIKPLMIGLLAVLASGLASAQTLTIVSGNGQLTCPSCTTSPSHFFEPLIVQLRDAAGNPIANETVTWVVQTPTTSFIAAQGTVNGSTTTTTTTDANGRSQVTFVQGTPIGFFIGVPYVQSNVVATARGATVVFTETTAVAAQETGVAQVTAPQLTSPTSGAVITGRTGETSPTPIQVTVLTITGQGVPGIGITLVPTSTDTTNLTTATCAGGTGGTVLTDASGVATCNVLFGGQPGSGSFTVRIGGGYAETLPISFSVTVGAPRFIRVISGNNQSGNAGTNLPSPLLARVEDAGGNVLRDVPVSWQVLSGGFTLFNTRQFSDSQGLVSTNVTVGATPGAGQIRVSSTVDPSISATFTATTILNITGLTILSGNNQSAALNTAFADQLVVQVSNQGQPLSGIPVNFAVTSGNATLSAGTATTDTQGRASVGVTGGATAGAVVVTATAGSLSQTFNLTVRQPGPALQSSNFFNAAGFQRGDAALSPCGVAQVLAPGVATGIQGVVTPSNLVGPLPVQLAGVSIQMGNSFAPIYNVSNINGQERVTFQVPCEIQPGNVQVTVRVGQGSATVTVAVQAVSPGIFETTMSDGRNRAVLLRPDGTFVSLENPARRGEIIRMFVTGIGQGSPPIGSNQPGIPNVEIANGNPLIVGVNHAGVRVVSGLLARNLIGVWEVAFEVPTDTPAGSNVPLAVAVDTGGQAVLGNGSAMPVQ